MHWRFAVFVCAAASFLFSLQIAAQEALPPSPLNPAINVARSNSSLASAKTINALLLKSWGTTSVWEDLKTNWSKYGKIPITVDDTTYIDSDFTYQDLVESKANVLVISNPSGNFQQYSAAEIAAVAKYAKKGHAVIGTYLVFQYSTTDNRGLAPVFGMSSSLTYNVVGLDNVFDKVKQHPCLFKGITGSSWTSTGFNESQVAGSTWTGNLGKAVAQAESDSYLGVITLHKTKTYTGIYISNFPEYFGGPDDEQLLYNAVVCYK